MPKEKISEIEVTSNKTVTHIMEFFISLYKHEFLLGSPDGASIFECDPNGVYENHTYSIDKNVYYKTENIYKYDCDSGTCAETLLCHNNTAPLFMYNMGHYLNSGVYSLGIPHYAKSTEDFLSYDETIEFIGFGKIQNSVPIMADGVTTEAQNAIIKIDVKMSNPNEFKEIRYDSSDRHLPASWGFPPAVFFEDTYDPEVKNQQWFNVGNRTVFKRENGDGTFGYRLGIPNTDDMWKEVHDGTYIRDFVWDNDEFYKERITMKNHGRANWLSWSAYGGQIIIEGEKKSANTFYIYHHGVGEDRYRFGGFIYFSDDYDQY